MTVTLADNKTDSVEGLDFKPGCCCEAPFCGTHPHRTECGAEASVIIAVHCVNHCVADRAEVEIDVNGDEVGPMCTACHDRIVEYTKSWLARLTAAARRYGGIPVCLTCHAPIVHLSDVIRDVRPL